MKIISWNCNGALRKKLDIILQENADIYCFQESEHPDKWFSKVEQDFQYPIYINDNNSKGIAILVKKGINFSNANWETEFVNNLYGNIKDKSMRYFLPILIDNKYTIINLWCHKNNSEHFAYKGQLWKYLVSNKNYINKNTVFIGDFNANKIWDDADCWWNMTDNNNTLNSYNLYSAYHKKFNEDLGKETIPTFYLYRHLDRAYHIDYAYANPIMVCDFRILNISYLKYSDHLPICLILE